MKQFQPTLTPGERLRILEENATKTEDTTYQRPLSEEELSIKREKHIDNSIQLNIKAEELAKIKDQYKKEMQPMVDENKVLLTELKTRQATVQGRLFYMPNFDDSMMEVYDEEGLLVTSRRLRPDEKQGTIFQMGNTAN